MAAIDGARQMDLSYLPKDLRKDLASAFERAGRTFALVADVRAAEAAIAAKADAYLGLKEDTPTCALLPIGWPLGKYGRPPRKSVDECLFFGIPLLGGERTGQDQRE